MKVYLVVNVLTTPHGDEMGDGAVHGVFASRKSANAYIRYLIEQTIYNGGYRWKYAVRSFKVED